MSMVKSYDGSCENSCNGSQMQVRRSESRSTPILVMHFKTKVHEKQAEKEPFVEPCRTRSVLVVQHARDLESAITRLKESTH